MHVSPSWPRMRVSSARVRRRVYSAWATLHTPHRAHGAVTATTTTTTTDKNSATAITVADDTAAMCASSPSPPVRSSTFTVCASAPLRLSRRAQRQRARQLGPLWRYTLDAPPQEEQHDEEEDDGCHVNKKDRNKHDSALHHAHTAYEAMRARAAAAGLLSSSSSTATELLTSRADNSSSRVDDVGVQPLHDDNNNNMRRSMTDCTAMTHSNSNNNNADNNASDDDALLAFLTHNEGDAAVLLATWAAVRRCCVHAAALGTTVALYVRYCVHVLLRRRAVAATLRLYERLLHMGIELQSRDVWLLLSNMPYERAVSRAELHGLRAQNNSSNNNNSSSSSSSSSSMYDDDERRTSSAKRHAVQRSVWRAEENKTRARYASAVAATTATATTTTTATITAAMAASNTAQAQETDNTDDTDGSCPRYPAWVRNWVLYEVSMGNLDMYDEDEGGGGGEHNNVSTNDGRRQQRQATAAISAASTADDAMHCDEDMVSDVTAACVRSERHVAAQHVTRVLSLTSIVEHLHLLQLATPSLRRRRQWWRRTQQQQQQDGTRARALRARRTDEAMTAHRGGRVRRRQRRRCAQQQHDDAHALPSLQARQRVAYADEALSLVCRQAQHHTDATAATTSMTLSSPALRAALHNVVRAAHSPRIALRYAELRWPAAAPAAATTTTTVDATHDDGVCNDDGDDTDAEVRDAALLLARTAATAPWQHSRRVEWLYGGGVSSSVLLRTARVDCAYGFAARALWMAHLCVRTAMQQQERRHRQHDDDSSSSCNNDDDDDDDDRVAVLLQSACVAWCADARVRRGQWHAMLDYAFTRMQLATAHLCVEVRRYSSAQRACASLAASLRSGVYVPMQEATAAAMTRRLPVTRDVDTPHGVHASPPEQLLRCLHARYGAPLSSSSSSSTTAQLPPSLVDAFCVSCEAVVAVLRVGLASAQARNNNNNNNTRSVQQLQLQSLHTLLEQAVYGPFSVWAAYAHIYAPAVAAAHVMTHHATTATAASSSSAVRSVFAIPHTHAGKRVMSEEAMYVSVVVAHMFVRVLRELASSSSSSSSSGDDEVDDEGDDDMYSVIHCNNSGSSNNCSSHTPGARPRVVSALRECGFAATHVRLLLELTLTALDGAAATLTCCGGGESVWWQLPCAHEVCALQHTLTRLAAPLLRRLLRVRPRRERDVFAALPPEAVAAMSLFVRVCVAADDVRQRAEGGSGARTAHRSDNNTSNNVYNNNNTTLARLPHRSRVWWRACVCDATTLARRVRAALSRRERAVADASLCRRRCQRHQRQAAQQQQQQQPLLRQRQQHIDKSSYNASTLTAAMAAVPVTTLLAMRHALYTAALATNTATATTTSTSTTAVHTVARRLVAQCDGRAALAVVAVALCDVSVMQHSLGVGFFADVLRALARRRRRRSRHDEGGNDKEVRMQQREEEDAVTLHDAAAVYWLAVDHTAPSRTTTTAAGAGVMRRTASDDSAAWRAQLRRHERAVLTTCLLPLLRVCVVAANDVAAGQRWLRRWVDMHTHAERHDAAWQRLHIAALAALHDARALQMCVRLCTQCTRRAGDASLSLSAAASTSAAAVAVTTPIAATATPTAATATTTKAVAKAHALLCRTALQHPSWLRALQTLCDVYAITTTPTPTTTTTTMSTSSSSSAMTRLQQQQQTQSQERTTARTTVYPLPVLHTLLALLARSRTNLSNTALRLHTQQVQVAWDAQASVQLTRLLLRARRWSLALRHVHAALRTSAMQHHAAHANRNSNNNDNDNETTSSVSVYDSSGDAAVWYVQLLLCGLQACAIGGCGGDAAALYDAYKAALHAYTCQEHDSDDNSSNCSDMASSTTNNGDDNKMHSTDVLEQALHTAAAATAAAATTTNTTTAAHEAVADAMTRNDNSDDDGEDDVLTSGDVVALLQRNASRARAYFFRAMVKKHTSLLSTTTTATTTTTSNETMPIAAAATTTTTSTSMIGGANVASTPLNV